MATNTENSGSSGPTSSKGAQPGGFALLVIDYQNDFCHPDGAFAQRGLSVAGMQAAARRTTELVDWAHGEGLPCIFALTEHSRWFDNPGWVARGRHGATLDVPTTPVTAAGSWGAEPYLVAPGPRDLVIIKHRYSAFAYTPLELALQAVEARMLIVAGVTTNVCVRQSVMDAVMRGWHSIVVSDCTAAPRPEEHDRAIEEFSEYSNGSTDLAGLIGHFHTGSLLSTLE